MLFQGLSGQRIIGANMRDWLKCVHRLFQILFLARHQLLAAWLSKGGNSTRTHLTIMKGTYLRTCSPYRRKWKNHKVAGAPKSDLATQYHRQSKSSSQPVILMSR
jgi:hypothetical protein